MAELWERLNQVARPLDNAVGAGLSVLKKTGLYAPFQEKIYQTVRADLRKQFDRDHHLEIEGLENVPATGGAILAPNHQSWLDVQVVVASLERPVRFIAKSMFETWPFLRHLIELSNSVYIRRGGDDAGLQAVAESLRNGDLVCIFPEGTIPGEEDVARWEVEPDTGLLRGKTGVARLALMAGVPVIPIGLSGTGRAFPPEAYPRLQQLPVRRKVPITIRFGKPLYFQKSNGKPGRNEVRSMTKTVMKAISGLIDHDRNFVPQQVPVPPLHAPQRKPTYAFTSEPRPAGAAKAPVGVLVLHGFTSHIACVTSLEALLKERGLPYRFPLLRGHGTKPRDLVGVAASDWYEDGEAALWDLLGECEKVVVIGHSMGGLVTLDLAARHGDKLAGAIVAAPALKFADPLAVLTPLVSRVVSFWPSPNAYNDRECAKRNQNYPKFPTDAFVELYRYAGDVGNRLSFVKVPLTVLHSRKDQVISPKAAEAAMERTSSQDKTLVWFEKSGHEMFLDLEADAVTAEVGKALDGLLARTAEKVA
jgi:carboxylesterase